MPPPGPAADDFLRQAHLDLARVKKALDIGRIDLIQARAGLAQAHAALDTAGATVARPRRAAESVPAGSAR